MRACLPTAPEQAENFRFGRREILRPDSAECCHSHFLDNTIRHDRNGLDTLDIKQNNETAIPVPGRDRQNSPAFDSCGKRMPGHIRSDPQRPHAGTRTTSLLGFETVSESRISFRLHRQINLTPWAVERGSLGQLAIDVFCCCNSGSGSQRFLDFFVVQQQRHRFKNCPVLRNGIRPPASSIWSRNSGAGVPFRDLPVVRFAAVPFVISTRRRSPLLTRSWMPATSSIGSPTSWLLR